jgi:hypothetical protein
MAGFTEGPASYTSLAFSPDGILYIAFQDGWNNGWATAMKYDSVYVGISELRELKLSVYPNPASDEIILETSGLAEGSHVIIEDPEGRELIVRQITQSKIELNISSLPDGIYFVKLTSDRKIFVG